MAEESSTLEAIVEVKVQADKAVQEIIRYNEALNDNRNAIDKLDKSSKTYEKDLIQLKEKEKQLNAEKRTAEKIVRNEIKVGMEQEGSLKRLRAELSSLTNAYDNLSKHQRDNEKVGADLREAINRTTNEIKKAEFATQRYYRNVGNYTNSILSAVGGNTAFGRALQGIVAQGGGASGAISGITTNLGGMGAAFSGLLANPLFLAMAGGQAANWFKDYNDGLESANRLTREFTGYTGEALTDLRSRIKATADVMGKDYKDVLDSVDTLMSHFHITGAEAMQVINDGFVAGADVNGKMLELLKQYAPAFKNAGIGASELVAYIQQTRSGIFSENGLALIAEGTARIRAMSSGLQDSLRAIGIDVDDLQRKMRDGTMTSADALKMVAEQLKGVDGQTKEYADVITDVFGKKGKLASQEMIEGIADMSTKLEDLKTTTGEYGELLEEQIQITTNLEKKTAELFEVQDGGWETTKLKVKNFGKNALLWLVTIINGVKIAFLDMGEKIAYVWHHAGNGVSAFATIINSLLLMVKDTASAFSGLGDVIKGALSMDSSLIGKGWDTMTNGIASAITTGVGRIRNALTQWGQSNYQLRKDMDARVSQLYSGASGYDAGESASGNGYVDLGGNNQGGDTNAKGSGKSSKSGKSGKSSAKTAKQTADDAKKAQETLAKQLASAAEQLRKKTLEADAKQGLEAIDTLYNAQKKEVEDKYKALGTLTTQQEQDRQLMLDDIERKRQADKDAYNQKQIEEARKTANDVLQARLEATEEGSQEEMILRLAQLDLQFEAEAEKYKDNAEMLELLTKKNTKKRLDIEKDYAKKSKETEKERMMAIAGAMGAAADLIGQFSEQSKAAAVASKVLSFGQIAVSQGVAIAEGIKDAMAVPFPANIAAIATTIAAIMTGITQAISIVSGAKFATGGYVRGAGTSTSDSIHARLSNGESVINANSTGMFAPLLSSLNMLGGGVPIQASASVENVQGEEMLARAFVRGAAALPSPVVGVKEFNQVADRVTKIVQSAKL